MKLRRRTSEQRTAIAAAEAAGIQHIVYTAVSGVWPKNPALSAVNHYQSELHLRESGMVYPTLRDAPHSEILNNILFTQAVEAGALKQAKGAGARVPVARADVALVSRNAC